MKKSVLRMLTALLLLAVMALPVLAATNTVTAKADKNALRPGDRVTVTVDFACEEAVSTVSALLEFDSEVFRLVEGTCNDQLGATFTSFNKEHGGLALLFSDAKPREGELGRFVLEVKTSAADGETELTVKPVYKNGAEELKADSVKLKLTVGCVHEWDAQGLCVHCKAQKPVEPTTPSATTPPATTDAPPVTTGTIPVPTGTTAEVPDEPTADSEPVGTDTRPAAATGTVTEPQKPAAADGEAPQNSKSLLWGLLLVVTVAGGCAAFLLLRKKRA